jgi:hypothetical protein
MNHKIFTYLVLIVSVLALTFGQAPTAGFAQQKGGPVTPTLPSGVPASGPLTPAQIQALPKTAQPNIAVLNSSVNAGMPKAMAAGVNGKNIKAKVDAAVSADLQAGKSLKNSLSGRQRADLAAVFSQHQSALQSLVSTTAQVTVGQLPKTAPTLAGAQNLSNAVTAWKAALDADVAKVLTKPQMAWYQASSKNPPTLNSSILPAYNSTDAYYAYLYAEYGYIDNYYGEEYAYYGWLNNPYSYSYDYYAWEYSDYALDYAYYAYDDAYYAYYDSDFIDAAFAYWESRIAQYYEYYGYVYAYYAYYYLTDHSGGYYYYSYYDNMYGYVYNYDGYYYAYYNLTSFLVTP